MSVNIRKNEKICLRKTEQSLANVAVAMGWDVNTHKNSVKRGLFGSLFGGSGGSDHDYDLDASALVCYRNGETEIVYYANLIDRTRCVKHGGDNLTGAGDGDDETIMIKLDKLPESVTRIVIGANIYQAHERNQDFGNVENAFLRIYNVDNNVEMLRYDLTNEFDGKTAVIFGELNRIGNDWEFKAVGTGLKAKDIREMFSYV